VAPLKYKKLSFAELSVLIAILSALVPIKPVVANVPVTVNGLLKFHQSDV